MRTPTDCWPSFATRRSAFSTRACRSNTASSKAAIDRRKAMIEIAIPGGDILRLTAAVLDFNGTLSQDGRVLDGVAERLRSLAASLDIHVATGNPHGNAH